VVSLQFCSNRQPEDETILTMCGDHLVEAVEPQFFLKKSIPAFCAVPLLDNISLLNKVHIFLHVHPALFIPFAHFLKWLTCSSHPPGKGGQPAGEPNGKPKP
jgi:hypothetical protein